MLDQFVNYARRPVLTAAAVLAAVAGTGSAIAIAGTPQSASAARAASRLHRGGRTSTPQLNRSSFLVQAGRRIRVLVNPHAVWGHPRTCEITISRGSFRRSFLVHGVVSDFAATLSTARNAMQGSWQLAVGCSASHQHASRQAVATLLVASSARARGALTGRARPDIQPLQARTPVQTGKYGLGGTPPNPGFPNGQCTFFAYEQRADIYWTSVNNGAPRYGWDADKWSVYAAQFGHYPEGSTPEVGAVMVEPASSRSYVGHVAYVTQVIDGSHWVTQEMNTDGRGVPNKVFTVYDDNGSGGYYYSGGQLHRHVVPGTVFIYGGPAATPQPVSQPQPQPAPQPQPTPTPTPTSPTQTQTQTTSTAPQPTPPPAPSTWNETVGGVTHTWTNYTNAGGTQGPSIATGQTVQVYCRVQGFRVADGDTWWYRIASPPWSGTYYASADAFYNNGQTSGSLQGTPFVDSSVAGC